MKKYYKIWFGLIVIIVFCISQIFSDNLQSQVKAVPEEPATVSLKQKFSVDPHITFGKLENGLRYYIRENHRPENRAELRLIVNAGSVLEDENQLGLAHFVEHMAFNGTKHFEKQELVNYLESIGMKFGPEINASTGFDETIYQLMVPTDSSEIMKTAFQILADWSQEVSFDNEEIDKERGVIIEEWRLGRGAQARMLDKQLPILFKGSRYAERLPIGKKEIIENFDYETLKQFYRDWYRPDLMAVIAVGNFDKPVIEKLIKKYFSGIPPASGPRSRQLYGVPDHKETLFAIATDKEATSASVSVYYKQPLRDKSTIGAYRRSIVEHLYNGMFNQRLSELTQKSDPPFLGGYSGQGLFIRSKEVYFLSAAVEDKGIERGLDAILVEAERVARFGFTASELERQNRSILRSIERAYTEREKTNSVAYAEEYIRNFLYEEPIPGIEYEFELYNRFVPEITLEEINKLASEWITDKNRVIMVNAPEKEGLHVPTEQELLAVFESVWSREIAPYEDTVADKPLIENIPEPGNIVEEKTIEDVNVTEWKLSNGVRVILKSTDFKEDQILFRAFSPGGTSLASNEDYISADNASGIVASGGAGSFSAIDLQKKLAGKVASVSPFINSLQEGLSGSASPKDIETLFQLIYLRFTAPRKDREVFSSIKTRSKAMLKNRNASPVAAFQDTLQVTLTQHHIRTRPLTPELIDEMDLEKSYVFYKDRFADAGDFTFVFVGNLDMEMVKPLVCRYLGGLPSTGREESWRDVEIDYPKGVIKKTVRKGLEPKSQTSAVFTGSFDYTRKNNHLLKSMVDVLDIKLREKLREELGGTYGVRVGESVSRLPDPEYSVRFSFGSDPERVDELMGVLFKEIEDLKTSGVSEEYLTKVKETQRRTREINLKQNEFWLSVLASKYRFGEDPGEILKYDELVNSIDSGVIQETARKYLNINNYILVSLYPETEK